MLLFKIRMAIATVVIFNSPYAYQKSPFVMDLFTPTHLPIKELTNCLENKAALYVLFKSSQAWKEKIRPPTHHYGWEYVILDKD